MPRDYRVAIRGVALLATLGSLLIATKMFLGYEAAEGGVALLATLEIGRASCRERVCLAV